MPNIIININATILIIHGQVSTHYRYMFTFYNDAQFITCIIDCVMTFQSIQHALSFRLCLHYIYEFHFLYVLENLPYIHTYREALRNKDPIQSYVVLTELHSILTFSRYIKFSNCSDVLTTCVIIHHGS